MIKLNKFDKIEVKWMDSIHDSGWVRESSYIEDDGEDSIDHFTCGYFLKETKRSLCIIQSRNNKPNLKGHFNVDSLMQIPKKCILNVKKLK